MNQPMLPYLLCNLSKPFPSTKLFNYRNCHILSALPLMAKSNKRYAKIFIKGRLIIVDSCICPDMTQAKREKC